MKEFQEQQEGVSILLSIKDIENRNEDKCVSALLDPKEDECVTGLSKSQYSDDHLLAIYKNVTLKVKIKLNFGYTVEGNHISSKSYCDVSIGTSNIMCARAIVVKLLLSPYNTPDGIIWSAEMPFGQTGLMNVSRPAVLRVYYGLNIAAISPTQWSRYTYGLTEVTGCLGMDPRVYSTKSMSFEML